MSEAQQVEEQAQEQAEPEATLEELFTNPQATDDKPPEQPAAEPVAEVDEPATEAEEPAAEPEQGSTSDPGDKMVPLAGLLDERDKRKSAEALLSDADALRKRLAELEGKKSDDALPSPFDDEDGFRTGIDNRIATVAQAQNVRATRLWADLKYDDWNERESQFIEMAEGDPQLIQQMMQADNPAQFAYETAVRAEKLAKLDEVEDVDKLRERIRAEERESLLKELEADDDAKKRKAESIPTSLASQRSADGGTHERVTDAEPLEDVIGR
jgi:hypothetical protein